MFQHSQLLFVACMLLFFIVEVTSGNEASIISSSDANDTEKKAGRLDCTGSIDKPSLCSSRRIAGYMMNVRPWSAKARDRTLGSRFLHFFRIWNF